MQGIEIGVQRHMCISPFIYQDKIINEQSHISKIVSKRIRRKGKHQRQKTNAKEVSFQSIPSNRLGLQSLEEKKGKQKEKGKEKKKNQSSADA